MPDLEKVAQTLSKVRALAVEYQNETGKPLGITGEVAEFEGARLLSLRLSDPRQSGYDAERVSGSGPPRVQIKGRRIDGILKPGSRVGSVDTTKEWDSVVLVLLDREFEPFELYEAERDDVIAALTKPGSRARNERGQLGISQFKSISSRKWRVDQGQLQPLD